MKKKIFWTILLLIITGAFLGWRMWNKPHAKVEDKDAISVTATALSKRYMVNEVDANRKYLNKVLEIEGQVASMEKNQDGKSVIMLMGEGDGYGVQCTMRDVSPLPDSGATVHIKGFCSGSTMFGVLLTDCIVNN